MILRSEWHFVENKTYAVGLSSPVIFCVAEICELLETFSYVCIHRSLKLSTHY